jgi:L-lactate dehydrogenase complex protein LldG
MVVVAVSSARDEILERVRAALADVPVDDEVPVEREYRFEEPGGTVGLLVERLEDYGAGVQVVSETGLRDALAHFCRKHGVERLVVPLDLPQDWTPADVATVPDDGLDVQEIDEIGAALTGCALAIAETGTIVFDSGARQGRRALTLVPDVHLCVIRSNQVVDGVPSAIRALATVVRDTARPLTLVSGPSATSDIELSRVEGVHGPRRLEVLIVQR